MPEYTQTLVSAMEYEALKNLDSIIRLAMSVPNMGEFLASAIDALDQVRADQGLPIPQPVAPRPTLNDPAEQKQKEVSTLAAGLIKRAIDSSRS